MGERRGMGAKRGRDERQRCSECGGKYEPRASAREHQRTCGEGCQAQAASTAGTRSVPGRRVGVARRGARAQAGVEERAAERAWVAAAGAAAGGEAGDSAGDGWPVVGGPAAAKGGGAGAATGGKTGVCRPNVPSRPRRGSFNDIGGMSCFLWDRFRRMSLAGLVCAHRLFSR